jgi:hypothetical protein
VQAEAQSARKSKSALQIKRRESSCPIAKLSLLLSVACVLPRAERGNVARSFLYFLGYVAMNPEGITGRIGEGFVVEAKSRYVSPAATSSTPMLRLSGCEAGRLQGDSL